MKMVLFTGSKKCKVFFSSAQTVVEYMSGWPPCSFILSFCNSKYLIYSKA